MGRFFLSLAASFICIRHASSETPGGSCVVLDETSLLQQRAQTVVRSAEKASHPFSAAILQDGLSPGESSLLTRAISRYPHKGVGTSKDSMISASDMLTNARSLSKAIKDKSDGIRSITHAARDYVKVIDRKVIPSVQLAMAQVSDLLATRLAAVTRCDVDLLESRASEERFHSVFLEQRSDYQTCTAVETSLADQVAKCLDRKAAAMEDCVQFGASHAAKATECCGLQAEVDTAACARASHARSVCKVYVDCRSSAVSLHEDAASFAKQTLHDLRMQLLEAKQAHCIALGLVKSAGDVEIMLKGLETCESLALETSNVTLGAKPSMIPPATSCHGAVIRPCVNGAVELYIGAPNETWSVPCGACLEMQEPIEASGTFAASPKGGSRSLVVGSSGKEGPEDFSKHDRNAMLADSSPVLVPQEMIKEVSEASPIRKSISLHSNALIDKAHRTSLNESVRSLRTYFTSWFSSPSLFVQVTLGHHLRSKTDPRMTRGMCVALLVAFVLLVLGFALCITALRPHGRSYVSGNRSTNRLEVGSDNMDKHVPRQSPDLPSKETQIATFSLPSLRIPLPSIKERPSPPRTEVLGPWQNSLRPLAGQESGGSLCAGIHVFETNECILGIPSLAGAVPSDMMVKHITDKLGQPLLQTGLTSGSSGVEYVTLANMGQSKLAFCELGTQVRTEGWVGKIFRWDGELYAYLQEPVRDAKYQRGRSTKSRSKPHVIRSAMDPASELQITGDFREQRLTVEDTSRQVVAVVSPGDELAFPQPVTFSTRDFYRLGLGPHSDPCLVIVALMAIERLTSQQRELSGQLSRTHPLRMPSPAGRELVP